MRNNSYLDLSNSLYAFYWSSIKIIIINKERNKKSLTHPDLVSKFSSIFSRTLQSRSRREGGRSFLWASKELDVQGPVTSFEGGGGGEGSGDLGVMMYLLVISEGFLSRSIFFYFPSLLLLLLPCLLSPSLRHLSFHPSSLCLLFLLLVYFW